MCCKISNRNKLALPFFVKIVLVSLALSTASPSGAQHNSKPIDVFVSQFSVDEGLSQSMVKRVFQDSQNLIWLTTGDGLHFFDGKKFKIFRVPKTPPFSPSDNHMRSIAEVSPGLFLIASKTSILFFDSKSGTFLMKHRVSDSKVFPLESIGRYVVWFNNKYFIGFNDTLLHPLSLSFGIDNLPIDFIPKKIEYVNGKTFILGDEGYVIVDGMIGIDTISMEAKYFPVIFNDICKVADGSIFLLREGKIYTYSGIKPPKIFFNTNIPNADILYFDSKETIWLAASKDNAVYSVKEGKINRLRFLVRQGRLVEEVSPFTINFYEDHERSVWIGTDGQGVFHYQSAVNQFNKADIGFVKGVTSTENAVWAITFQNGIWRLSFDLKEAVRVKPKFFTNQVNFLDIESDINGGLWIASNENLYLIDNNGEILYQKKFPSERGNFIKADNGCVNYYADSCMLAFNSNQKEMFLGKSRSMFVTSSVYLNDTKWEGTPFGLFVSNLKPINDNVLYSPKFRLLEASILSIVEFNNLLWVASRDGLMIFNKEKLRLDIPKELQGLSNETINSLEVDSHNRLWYSSNRGIGVIPIEMDRVITFSVNNNLQSLEFNSRASHSNDSIIFFGGINGLNSVNATNYLPKPHDLIPILVKLFVEDKSISDGVPINHMSKTIHWSTSSLSGKISSSSYLDPSNQSFSFQLHNLENSWSTPSNSGEFNYRNIPPGRYTLLAKCSDANGFWGNPKVLLDVVVKPPVWKTWWFICSLGSIFFVIVIAVVKQSQRQLYMKQIVELEHQNAIEKERLRISRDLHDELGTGLSLIMLNTSMALSSNNNKLLHKNLSVISKNSKELYENMNNLIWLLRSDNQTFDNLFARIREKMSEILEEASYNYSITLPEFSGGRLITREACREIFLIIKEAVNNSIKHSKGSKIQLDVIITTSNLIIIVIDDGVGFNLNNLDRPGSGIFNMKSRTENFEGNFLVSTSDSQGAKIRIEVPLRNIEVK
jgi:signal transduction histidine kinase